MTMESKSVIAFWYKKLNFPSKYDEEFYRALEEVSVPEDSGLSTYDLKKEACVENLLHFLYFCQDLKHRYEEKGIGEDILLDTLHDLVIWTDTWTDLEGKLCLGELYWLKLHLDMQLFKLGRLQFRAAPIRHDVAEFGLAKGDPIIEVHIPENGAMAMDLCRDAFEQAKVFYSTYYPDYNYRAFTCHSWLMDTTMADILPETSNILAFQNLFHVVDLEPEDAILKYVFKWNTTRESLAQAEAKSRFAAKVKTCVEEGRTFYQGLGVIPV